MIKKWMTRRDTIEFLGLWESMHNINFNSTEFGRIKSESGYNAFTLTPKRWTEKTNASGVITKAGRYAETLAHIDIALEFASWISAEFKLYIITDYKRLKNDEITKKSLSWNLHREIARINYKIHTDAIKKYLTKELTNDQLYFTYASEADMLNVVLFDKTAKEWRNANQDKKRNIRDYASLEELLVLSNTESHNAYLIEIGLNQQERMIALRKYARNQILSLEKLNKKELQKLEVKNEK